MNIAAHALAGTLIHFLWEGTLIACGLGVAMQMFRSSSARLRYGLASFAMLAMLAAFGITLWEVWPDTPATVRNYSSEGRMPVSALPARPDSLLPDADARFRWLAALWVMGVCGFSLHSLVSWMGAQRLRKTGVCLAPESWQTRVGQIAARMGLTQAVALYESALAEVPVVIGVLRPVILMPAGLLANFPAEQLEYFLIHELAHIRRHDYLINLLQSVAEDLLFYHPAVWWVSRLIREERENCCDDVVRTDGDARAYAAALMALEQARWTGREAAMAANGGHLRNRIQRLLDPGATSRSAGAPIAAAGVLAAVFVAAAIAFPTPEQVANTYQHWLDEEVVYIMKPAERSAFPGLNTDAERERFIEQFWERRNPAPGTGRNAFKEEHYRRIDIANRRFGTGIPGWRSDRGRIYITFGPPDEIDSHPSGGVARAAPYEDWSYRFIEGIGNDVNIEFVDEAGTGDYRMTRDPAEIGRTPQDLPALPQIQPPLWRPTKPRAPQ
jgi:GWxTD domain-containing protein